MDRALDSLVALGLDGVLTPFGPSLLRALVWVIVNQHRDSLALLLLLGAGGGCVACCGCGHGRGRSVVHRQVVDGTGNTDALFVRFLHVPRNHMMLHVPPAKARLLVLVVLRLAI
jgi:hypothetical protein